MHSPLVRFCLLTLGVLALAHVAHAQSVRGVVVDASARPVSGVVVQLLDSAGALAARSLSNESGDYRLTAPYAGTFRIRSSRIGFRPTLSAELLLRAGESRVERIVLTGIQVALDTMRVVSSNSCRAMTSGGSATFAVLEQARTALLATEITNAARGITATTLDYESRLDPAGRRVIRQESKLRAATVRQPWSATSPDSLHRLGYVLKTQGDSNTYYAPGLEMLASEVFMGDHCFELRREGSRVGIMFEPTAERRRIAEIRGTIWLDVATAHLERLEYSYVNLPSELDAAAGGELHFSRLANGGWTITRWRIRMPVFELRFGSQRIGTTGTHVAELSEQGGELVMAVRDRDTLWAQPARVLKGVLLDSTTGRRISGARLEVLGVGRRTTSDAEGRFALNGLLPGDYALEVRTLPLDSVGGRHEAIVEFRTDKRELEVRVPDGTQFMSGVCGDRAGRRPAGIFGRVKVRGVGVPGDSRLVVSWLEPRIRAEGGNTVVSRDKQSRTTRPDSTGAFRLCELPTETDLAVMLETDSALTEPMKVRLEPGERFARLEIPVDRTISMFASFSGVVRRDSGMAVSGAEVALEDLYRVTTTDTNGVFYLRDIQPGEHHLIVRKLGLAGFDTVLTFTRNEETKRNISLRRTQVLKGVVTRASALPPSFDEHRYIGLGSFLTRDELKKFEGARLADVVSQMRGMRIVDASSKNELWPTSSRRPDCPLPLKLCPADTVPGSVQRCWSQVYLDKMLMNPGRPTPPYNLNEFPTDRIEAVEYFAGPAETPSEYSTLNATCGVLVLHSRRSP